MKSLSNKPPTIAGSLLDVMCSDVWLTSYELLLLYESLVDENVNPDSLTHIIWDLKKTGALDFKVNPSGKIGPGGKSYLYRKMPIVSTS